MGEHDTWLTVILGDEWHELTAQAQGPLGREWEWMMFTETEFSLVHVVGAILSFFFILFLVSRYRASIKDETQGVVPPRKWGLAAMVDGFLNACFKMSSDILGEEDAKRFLPLIGTLALFIFCCNLQGLIPGLLPATDTLKTNFALAILVFVVYNAVGLKENGMGHLAHFLGPKINGFPWLAPLMLPIEVASHLNRPVALAVRLMGNMLADHKVVGIMLVIFPVLLPVPFLLLGTLVVIVQTLVFTLLTVIYIRLALEHSEEH